MGFIRNRIKPITVKLVNTVLILLIPSLLLGALAIRKNETTNVYQGTNIERDSLEIATFAGGCFWCMESSIEAKDGVV